MFLFLVIWQYVLEAYEVIIENGIKANHELYDRCKYNKFDDYRSKLHVRNQLKENENPCENKLVWVRAAFVGWRG